MRWTGCLLLFTVLGASFARAEPESVTIFQAKYVISLSRDEFLTTQANQADGLVERMHRLSRSTSSEIGIKWAVFPKQD